MASGYFSIRSNVHSTNDGANYLGLSTGSVCLAKEIKEVLSKVPPGSRSTEPINSKLRSAIQSARTAIEHMKTQTARCDIQALTENSPLATFESQIRDQKTVVEPIIEKVKKACVETGALIITFNRHVADNSLRTASLSIFNHCNQRTLLLNEAEALMNEYDNNCAKTVLVVGGGISGLMTAWILLDKGYRVSIVAKEWESMGSESEQGRITSQVAGALWEYPPGGCGLSEIEVPLLAYSKLEQYRTWAMQSFLFYDLVANNDNNPPANDYQRFGVKMKTLYQFFHTDPTQPSSAQEDLIAKSLQGHNEKYDKLKRLNDTRSTPFFDKLQVSSVSPINATLQNEGIWKDIGINFDSFTWGYKHEAPVIDTDVAIKRLMEIVKDKGAILETRTIEGDLHLHERELMDDFKADLIVNASGLGAHKLANDDQVFPVRGAVRRVSLKDATDAPGDATAAPSDATAALNKAALALRANALLVPAQYHTDGSPGKTIFIVPRNDETLIVGSIIQRNNGDLKNLTTESPEVKQMWKRATKFLGCLEGLAKNREPEGGPFARGLRPFSHSNVRVAADNRTTSCRVVHNYGHGGSGWTLAVGCAWTCVRIIEKMLHEGKSGSVANAEIWGLHPQ